MYVTQDAQHIVLPWRADLAQLIPHAREITHQAERFLVVPNQHDEAKVCRNVGVPVPAPILTRYGWAGQKPWDVQRTTSALLTESPRAYVLSTMGTGKTRSALFALDYLMGVGAVRRALIAAPLSTLTPVWESEIFRVLPHRSVRVLYGDRAKRLKLLAEDAELYIINHHGLELLVKQLIARAFDAVVIDELAVFRTKGTNLWKAATTVVNAPTTAYAWGMTGAPTPTAPTDAWAQVRLITPERTTRTMRQFQDATMRQITSFKWVPRPEANDLVFAAMQPSVRFTRDDVMELPETSYADRQVALEPETLKAYRMLFDKMRMHTNGGQSITAANEGVLQNKLMQVAAGYIYTDARTVYKLPNKARLQALEDTINETDRKVIVFVPYIHALDGVAAYLRALGRNVGVVSGSVARGARDRIFQGFQDGATPDTIVAHPACMSHGLTLTAANTIIWYVPPLSLETYEQANARITRPGQRHKTMIVHLSGTHVERATYTRLRNRAKMQGILLDMFAAQQVTY